MNKMFEQCAVVVLTREIMDTNMISCDHFSVREWFGHGALTRIPLCLPWKYFCPRPSGRSCAYSRRSMAHSSIRFFFNPKNKKSPTFALSQLVQRLALTQLCAQETERSNAVRPVQNSFSGRPEGLVHCSRVGNRSIIFQSPPMSRQSWRKSHERVASRHFGPGPTLLIFVRNGRNWHQTIFRRPTSGRAFRRHRATNFQRRTGRPKMALSSAEAKVINPALLVPCLSQTLFNYKKSNQPPCVRVCVCVEMRSGMTCVLPSDASHGELRRRVVVSPPAAVAPRGALLIFFPRQRQPEENGRRGTDASSTRRRRRRRSKNLQSWSSSDQLKINCRKKVKGRDRKIRSDIRIGINESHTHTHTHERPFCLFPIFGGNFYFRFSFSSFCFLLQKKGWNNKSIRSLSDVRRPMGRPMCC